jgi:hypothetical protein
MLSPFGVFVYRFVVYGVRFKMYITTFKVYNVRHWICGVSFRVRDNVFQR